MSRSFSLEAGERLPHGVRRVAAGRTADALERLRAEDDGGLATRVHEARKDLKKLRSLLRLVRGEMGSSAFHRESSAYRDAGRRLAGTRDAQVRLDTLSALEHRDGGGATVVPESFRQELVSERRSAEKTPSLDVAIAEIEDAAARIDAWPLRGEGWDAIAPGVRRAYAGGRRRLKALRSDPSDEAVHELRKRVKDLWYHLRLLRNAWPGALDEAAEQAHEISALLGDHRDLAMLAERARRSAALSDRDLESLEARIGAAQEELLSAAGPIARRLYAEEPKAFTRRLGIYWKEWRG